MEPLSVYRPVVADSDHFDVEQDPDPQVKSQIQNRNTVK